VFVYRAAQIQSGNIAKYATPLVNISNRLAFINEPV